MPPEENKTQDVQQDPAPIEPAVVETPIPVEKPVEPVVEETPVDTAPEVTPELAPAEQAQEEAPVVEPPVEQTPPEPISSTTPPATAQAEPVQTPPQPQNKITPQGRTSPVAPPSSAPPRGTTFSHDFVQKLLVKARAKIQERKRKKLDKIMTLFSERNLGAGDAKQITNKDIQKLLRISSATAVRYLDILERENRIKQVGNTGKSVFYIKV